MTSSNFTYRAAVQQSTFVYLLEENRDEEGNVYVWVQFTSGNNTDYCYFKNGLLNDYTIIPAVISYEGDILVQQRHFINGVPTEDEAAIINFEPDGEIESEIYYTDGVPTSIVYP